MSEYVRNKIKGITQTNLNNFKRLVRRSVFLSEEDDRIFDAIPDNTWKMIFSKNFNANYSFARRILLGYGSEIERVDIERVDREKQKIRNLDKSSDVFVDFLKNNKHIIFVTDFDNDGSLAQSVINTYLEIESLPIDKVHVEYAQVVNNNSNRGVTVDLVDKIINHKQINPKEEILVVTADNGINSLEEQIKIHEKFPNITLLITDHHNPDPDMVIQENEKAIIFNPKYQPTDFFKEFNISGATTVGVLLKDVLTKTCTPEHLENHKNHLETMQRLFQVSNLLDYVYTDPADKPVEPHVISKFFKLQPLLNINNSISKIITGEMPTRTIRALENKIEDLDVDILYEEAENIKSQNKIARVLLEVYKRYKSFNEEELNSVKREDFANLYLNILRKKELYFEEAINPNYIEQLRPYIFAFTADDAKDVFLSELNEAMVNVFESIRLSEQRMAEELRRGEIVTRVRDKYSSISFADENILNVFNRKFLNKIYNDENPGFLLTLDSIDPKRVSGSFRSLHDISDILANKKVLEKKYNIKIETPGHERAAGFIVTSNNPVKYPINFDVIRGINEFINESIVELRLQEKVLERDYLLTDFEGLLLIDKVNIAVRGNVSNFERINPIMSIDEDTIWVDKFSTKQYTMQDICDSKKYGYITIGLNFSGDTVIVPVELVRRVVEGGYKDYLSLGYLDGGVFMVDRVILSEDVGNVIDVRKKNQTTHDIIDAFETDFKDKNHVVLTREQIKDNPFFKYNDYGELDFDLFERMVIGVIDSNDVDYLTVFDVEANGFGNAKIMNLGAMNYEINQDEGTYRIMPQSEFDKRLFMSERGEFYLLDDEELEGVSLVGDDEIAQFPLEKRRMLLFKENGVSRSYYTYKGIDDLVADKKLKRLPFEVVRNHKSVSGVDGDFVVFNREIKGSMLAYLIHDDDLMVSQEMTHLTGITQEVLRRYGKPSEYVDNDMVNFYKGKRVLFGAHNTPYDARISRANLPLTYRMLQQNGVYDSALFSRREKLAYDDVRMSKFVGVEGLGSDVYFYNNQYSDINLLNFLLSPEDGYYPDRSGDYLLNKENGRYYLINLNEKQRIKLGFPNHKEEDLDLFYQGVLKENSNDMISLDVSNDFFRKKVIETFNDVGYETKIMLSKLENGPIPNTAIKYSVESMSAQWMINSLLLSDEEFNIKLVDLDQPKFAALADYKEVLEFFQKNYNFRTSPENNYYAFNYYYHSHALDGGNHKGIDANLNDISEFINEFLILNNDIQRKFSESWIYKKVLSVKDPSRKEVTNDLLELVEAQTSIPKYKIRQVFEEAIEFKEKYNIDKVLHHEKHINGPWRGDRKGDVVFEDKLTLGMLAKTKYNTYSRDISSAVDTFNGYVLEARVAFDKANMMSYDLAYDSYSHRQALLYDRANKSDMIAHVQDKEKKMESGQDVQIIKFKLGNDVLPPNTAVCGVTKAGIVIDREQIEKDSDMLAYIVVNEQLKNSLGKVKIKPNSFTDEAVKSAMTILSYNDTLLLDYKEDLQKRYQFVDYTRTEYNLNKSLKDLFSVIDAVSKDEIFNEEDKANYNKVVKAILNKGLDKKSIDIIESIVVKYIKDSDSYSLNNLKKNNFLAIFELLTNEAREILDDNVFDAVAKGSYDPNINKDKYDEGGVISSDFLANLEINRRSPIDNLLKNHNSLRLMNGYVDSMNKEVRKTRRMRI